MDDIDCHPVVRRVSGELRDVAGHGPRRVPFASLEYLAQRDRELLPLGDDQPALQRVRNNHQLAPDYLQSLDDIAEC